MVYEVDLVASASAKVDDVTKKLMTSRRGTWKNVNPLAIHDMKWTWARARLHKLMTSQRESAIPFVGDTPRNFLASASAKVDDATERLMT